MEVQSPPRRHCRGCDRSRIGNGCVMAQLKVTQVRSQIGGLPKQRATLRALGLRRLGDTVVKEDRPEIRGMVQTVTVSNKQVIGKPLEELAQMREARGVFLRRIRRVGLEIPIFPSTILNRGDEVEMVGTEPAVKRVMGLVGIPHRSDMATDLAAVGMAIFAGGLIGALTECSHALAHSLFGSPDPSSAVTLAFAMELRARERATDEARIALMRDRLQSYLEDAVPGLQVNGALQSRLVFAA